ncbi:hypothetical protein [Oceaniglobus trochenteri]|uniref:hypothetical protein n=1 Tax=Oceaniglobus trochenteri TaxID=2763260 RepID=UPI001CFF8CE9|nr:hypothetical protein [Oceaniglobus trochenteri]
MEEALAKAMAVSAGQTLARFEQEFPGMFNQATVDASKRRGGRKPTGLTVAVAKALTGQWSGSVKIGRRAGVDPQAVNKCLLNMVGTGAAERLSIDGRQASLFRRGPRWAEKMAEWTA